MGAATVETVTAKLMADPQYGKPNLLMLPTHEHGVFTAYYPLKGPEAGLGRSRQVMIDPITLTVKGERFWGMPGLSRQQLMPTLFHLHRYLLSGETGKTITGVGGMMLLILVLVGIVLWLPKLTARGLKQSVRIAHGGSWSRFTYTLHRAGGIFVAPVLATIAFSGWYLNLPKWVTPIISSVMTVSANDKPHSATPPEGVHAITPGPGHDGRPARVSGRAGHAHRPAPQAGRCSTRSACASPAKIRSDSGATRLWLDAYTGQRLGARDPLAKDAPSGDTLITWLYPLHSGEAFGTPGRAFITAFGLTPLIFAITGVLIWWKRRSGHRRHLARERERLLRAG